jgi:hypothetical protein
MVVSDSAVFNWLILVSSARAAEVKLTTPTAARPNVHLLNFIWFLRCCLVICLFYLHLRDKSELSQHRLGAIDVEIIENSGL